MKLIKLLDLTANLQEIQKIKEHIKWLPVSTISQAQIVGGSIGEITEYLN